MAATSTETMTATTVTLPSALAFLVSNFHSLVNIKLDGTNYMLWRIQIEGVMEANGFYGYLDGSIQSPPSEIRNAQGEPGVNPAYTLWRLIDSQLKSCLNASLSQATLPYVLGLRSACQIWESLAKRYNSLTESHVQELKDELYSVSKTSTIEAYVDKIQEISQKLTAAGCVVEDDELVFRTLQGLPKAFNGLRTAVRAVRTRGTKISFDDLVAMMKSEDIQLSKETSEVDANNTVLIASHSNTQSQKNIQATPGQPMFGSGFPGTGFNGSGSGGQNFSPQYGTQQQYFPTTNSQQYGQHSSRNFNRGRGGRPKFHCDICGRNNHSTNFCYYRANGPGYQGRGGPTTSQSYPAVYGPQGMPSIPVFQNIPSQVPVYQGQNGGFRPMMQPQTPAMPQTPTAMPTAFAGFTGQYSMPYGPSYGPSHGVNICPSGVFSGGDMMASAPYNENVTNIGAASQPWYFDTGATSHVTNNAQNITQPQQSAVTEGVIVGNGQNLQVTHSGNGFLPTSSASFHLSNILYTPQITHNLISVHKFAKDNHCLLVFDSNGLVI